MAVPRRSGPAVPNHPPVLPERCNVWPGMDDQNPHRPIQRYQALPQITAGPDARRADRYTAQARLTKYTFPSGLAAEQYLRLFCFSRYLITIIRVL